MFERFTNHQAIYKLLKFIHVYDRKYPPVGGLVITPSKNEAEVYIISIWLLNRLNTAIEYNLNVQILFISCREKLYYVSQKNIITVIEFLLKG